MKTTFCAILTILAVCATLTAALAQCPFSVTCQQSEPGIYTYTLYNNGVHDEVPWCCDFNWVLDWSESQTPAEFTILSAPEDPNWIVNHFFPWAAFDCWGVHPLPGESLTGFVVASDDPALFFRVVYESSQTWDLLECEGVIEPIVPEPSTILALLCGLGGLIWRKRK